MKNAGTPLSRSALMARIRSSGNRSTELRLIALFRTHGIKGWRRSSRLFGRPDFVFPKARLAIFVDGEFWHGHPAKCRMPSTNRPYWEAKIARNRTRDRVVNAHLRGLGWRVLRIWEHRLAPKHEAQTMKRIRESLNKPL